MMRARHFSVSRVVVVFFSIHVGVPVEVVEKSTALAFVLSP